MAIDFKEKIENLKAKDIEPLSEEELGYVKQVEEYIDAQIEAKLSTDNGEVWIDKAYVGFYHNPSTKKFFPSMTNARKQFLKDELLKRYENANWVINWHIDDRSEGNLSGGDYLILKGKK